ncbi:MAG: Flavodoxin reductase [Labilithrix sp.]|nr:Flavodoxin reductase [Labilithrix sp.]
MAMRTPASDVAFTPSVKAAQKARGSRDLYRRLEEGDGWETIVTDDLAAFIAQRNSLYIATASKDGQPYIQHRGGPRGFLRVVDEHTLGFADFVGNQQYITLGNLAENDRAFLFLMDYDQRRRVKVWGRARAVEGDEALVRSLLVPGGKGRAERAILFDVEAWDVNCRQHIPRKIDVD